MSQITNLKIREAVFKFLIQEATNLIIITANLLLQDKKNYHNYKCREFEQMFLKLLVRISL